MKKIGWKPLHWLVLAASVGLFACAKGASTLDDTINGGGGSTGVSTTCMNGTIEQNEDCEPTLPLGSTCMALMHGTGILLCNPMTCKYDTSMCSAGAGVAGSNP